MARPAEDTPISGAGATAEACGASMWRPVACSTRGGGATTPAVAASAFRRMLAVAENGTMGATARPPGKFGSFAVACLMSGGVTKLGFCSGVTGIAR